MLKKLIFVAGLISFCSCSGGGLPKDGKGEKTYVLDSRITQQFDDGKPYGEAFLEKLDGDDESGSQNTKYRIKMERIGDKLVAESSWKLINFFGQKEKGIYEKFNITIKEETEDGTLKGYGTRTVKNNYMWRTFEVKLFEISFARDSVFIKVDDNPQDKDRFVSLYKAH